MCTKYRSIHHKTFYQILENYLSNRSNMLDNYPNMNFQSNFQVKLCNSTNNQLLFNYILLYSWMENYFLCKTNTNFILLNNFTYTNLDIFLYMMTKNCFIYIYSLCCIMKETIILNNSSSHFIPPSSQRHSFQVINCSNNSNTQLICPYNYFFFLQLENFKSSKSTLVYNLLNSCSYKAQGSSLFSSTKYHSIHYMIFCLIQDNCT